MGQASAQVRGKPDTPKYDRERQGASAAVVAAPKAYNADADITADVKPEAVKEKKKVCSECQAGKSAGDIIPKRASELEPGLCGGLQELEWGAAST